MPEGDTLARAAETLRSWLVGRTITAVDARDPALLHRAGALVGRPVDSVEARAKHLLIAVGDRTIHSHMRMTGSWHVYKTGAPWRKSRSAMRLQLVAGENTAVCFNAPIVRIVATKDVDAVPGIKTLGPDVLTGIDPAMGAERIAALPAGTSIGDALLDQTAVSGLGNIWRCEALWECEVHPATPVAALSHEKITQLVVAGATLMGASARREGPRRAPRAYKRAGQPCRRCSAAIVAQKMGYDARTAYWCPKCQKAGD